MGKGFALAVTGPNRHLRGAGQHRSLAEDAPTPGYLTPARSPVTALSQQQGGSGSAAEAPHGVLDTSPPRHVASPRSRKTAARLLSTAPDRGAEFSAMPAARGKKPTKRSRSQPLLTTDKRPRLRSDPRGPRGSADVSVHGDGEAAAPRTSSSSAQPKYNLGKACNFQLRR